MSEVSFTMTNNVGLKILGPTLQYAAASGSDLYMPTTGGSTSLQFQFADAVGTVTTSYIVNSNTPVLSKPIPLPCTMTVTMMDLPVGIKTGEIIAVQQFAFGGPGASSGKVYYPSPLFQAITTTISGPSPSAVMAVTCTGAGYFSTSSLAGMTKPNDGFLVQFLMSGFNTGKQFAVTVAGADTTGQSKNLFTPFLGATFVLSAGTNTYQLLYQTTGRAGAALALSANTGPVFTFSSGAHYKATVGLASEQFASNPIVDDTGKQCGTMTFAAASTAPDNTVMVFTLTGSDAD